MADEPTQQPSRAEAYRKDAENFARLVTLENVDTETSNKVSLQSCLAALWAIAAELAEANERDREAEIRAKAAEAFVAGIQQQLAAQQIVVPSVQIKPPRGK